MGHINLKVISAANNSNKFEKPKFWKEKSVENEFTLGPMAHATLVRMKCKSSTFKKNMIEVI